MPKLNLTDITTDTLKQEELIINKLIERVFPGSENNWISIYPEELIDDSFNSLSDGYGFIGKVKNIFQRYKTYGLLTDYKQDGYGIRYPFKFQVIYEKLKVYQIAIKAELQKRERPREVKARLTIYPKDKFIFQAKTGTVKEANFTPGTNEYAVLMYFVDNQHQKFSSGQLADQLQKDPRQHSFPDPKGRVQDTIKAIRDKLCKDVILTDRGYYMDCEVVKK